MVVSTLPTYLNSRTTLVVRRTGRAPQLSSPRSRRIPPRCRAIGPACQAYEADLRYASQQWGFTPESLSRSRECLERSDPARAATRIAARCRRRDFGHMDLEITFNDPVCYTRPFSIKNAVKG